MNPLKQIASTSVIASLLLAGTAAIASEVPNTITFTDDNQVSETTVHDELLTLGFTNIEGLERDGISYSAEAEYEGRKLDLRVNPTAGTISHQPADLPTSTSKKFTADASDDDVKRELETLGYEDVVIVRRGDSLYDVSGLWVGAPVRLQYNPSSAAIIFVSRPAMPDTIDVQFPESATEDQVIERLQDEGFSTIRNPRLEGEVFEADATYAGRLVKLRLDLETGILINDMAGETSFGMPTQMDVSFPESATPAQITERLETLGFEKLEQTELSGEVYEAKAVYDGRPVSLHVDLESGVIRDGSRTDVTFGPPADINVPFPESATPSDIESRLIALGYSDVKNIREAGEVFETTATWAGIDYNLRVDAETGVISFE